MRTYTPEASGYPTLGVDKEAHLPLQVKVALYPNISAARKSFMPPDSPLQGRGGRSQTQRGEEGSKNQHRLGLNN